MKKELHALAEYIGAVTTIFLYFAPMPTILNVTRTETTERFSPLPYVATLPNSGMWIAYGSHNPLMILMYTAGIITEATYIAIFYGFSTHGVRRKIWWLLCADAVFYGIVLVISYGGHSEDAQIKSFIGKMSVISCVYMYASPLIMMGPQVLALTPSSGQFVEWFFWHFKRTLSQDKYSMISSSIGTALSITQIFVFLYVKCKSRDDQVAGINAEDAVVPAGGAGGSVAAGVAGGSMLIEMAGAAGGSVAAGVAGGSVAAELAGADGSIATEAASGSMAIEMAEATDGSEAANESEAIEVAGESVATGADRPMATEAASGSVAIEMARAADGSEAIEVADGSEVMEAAEGSVATEATSGSVAIEMAGAADGSEAIEAAGGSVATKAAGKGQVPEAAVEEA